MFLANKRSFEDLLGRDIIVERKGGMSESLFTGSQRVWDKTHELNLSCEIRHSLIGMCDEFPKERRPF